jgi:hypothetical protein
VRLFEGKSATELRIIASLRLPRSNLRRHPAGQKVFKRSMPPDLIQGHAAEIDPLVDTASHRGNATKQNSAALSRFNSMQLLDAIALWPPSARADGGRAADC